MIRKIYYILERVSNILQKRAAMLIMSGECMRDFTKTLQKRNFNPVLFEFITLVAFTNGSFFKSSTFA